MIHKVVLRCTGIIIFAALISSARSIPDSSDSMVNKIIRCISEKIFSLNSDMNSSRLLETSGRGQADELRTTGPLNLNESVIATLSKLAHIRLQNLPGYRQGLRRIPNPQKEIALPKAAKAQDSDISITNSQRNQFRGTDKVLDQNNAVEKLDPKPRIFHCHPIEDVYIPAVDKMVPAYICKLEFRQFIISSERFLEDYKYHLNITVDEATFQRLSILDKTNKGNSMASVIPVTLTQRQGDEFYGVKKTQN